MFPNISRNTELLANKIQARSKVDPEYNEKLQLWYRNGSSILLRDELAEPFNPNAPANSPEHLAHFNAWVELDSSAIRWRELMHKHKLFA